MAASNINFHNILVLCVKEPNKHESRGSLNLQIYKCFIMKHIGIKAWESILYHILSAKLTSAAAYEQAALSSPGAAFSLVTLLQNLIKMKTVKLSVAESTRIEQAAKNHGIREVSPVTQTWNMRKRERAGKLYIGDSLISYVRYCGGKKYQVLFIASEWPF